MATAEAMGYALALIVSDTGASPKNWSKARSPGKVVDARNPWVLAGTVGDLLVDRRRAATIDAAVVC